MVVDPLDDAVTGFTTPGLVDPAERAQRNRIRRRTGALRRRKRTRAKSLGKAKRLVDRQRHQRIHPHLRPIRRGGRSKFDDQFGCPLLTSTSYGSLQPDTGSQPENHANSPQKSLSQQHSTMWPSPTPQVEPSLSHVSPTNPEHPARPSRLGEEELTKCSSCCANSRALTLSAPVGSLQLGWKGTADKLAQQMLGEVLPVDPDGDALAGVAAREPGATGGVKQLELRAYEAAL